MSDELKPFLYALMRPNGQPEISGECVAEYEHVLDDAANEQNCTVVPLYTRAEPVRKVRLPEGREIARTYMGVVQSLTVYFRKDDVIAALKAANVEIES